jgi:hypothetical protein
MTRRTHNGRELLSHVWNLLAFIPSRAQRSENTRVSKETGVQRMYDHESIVSYTTYN